MHVCKQCNYFAKSNCNYKIHLKSKKHITLTEIYNKDSNEIISLPQEVSKFICENCNSSYVYKRNLTRHQKTCTKTYDFKPLSNYELELLLKILQIKNLQLK
jgi:hypothetical protein